MSRDEAVGMAITQALRDGIASTTDQLDIRDIIPDLDLLDASKNNLTSRAWQQPPNGTYSTVEQDVLIYGDIKNSDQKVIVFTGVKALQSTVYATTIRFDRGAGTLAIEDVQDIVSSSTGLSEPKPFSQPYMFASRQNCKIYIRPNSDAVGKKDKILFMGVVVEPLGVNESV